MAGNQMLLNYVIDLPSEKQFARAHDDVQRIL